MPNSTCIDYLSMQMESMERSKEMDRKKNQQTHKLIKKITTMCYLSSHKWCRENNLVQTDSIQLRNKRWKSIRLMRDEHPRWWFNEWRLRFGSSSSNGNSSKTRLIWKQTRVHSKLLISRNQTTDQAGIILQTTPNYVGVIWKPGSGLNS